jgi:hypothetical protein
MFGLYNSVMNKLMCTEYQWSDTHRGTTRTHGQKPDLVLLCTSHILCELYWDQTQLLAVAGR